MVSLPGDICVHPVWRPCLKSRPHFFEQLSFRPPDLSFRNLLGKMAPELPQSQSREANSVMVGARGSDSEVFACSTLFGMRRLDAAFGKTLRLTFALSISRRHGVGLGAGVTHRGRGCVSTEPTSMRRPN